MYPHELRDFIAERNYYLGGDDLIKAISPWENPQLSYIEYKPFENMYYMRDYEGNEYTFYAMPIEEAREKGLVRARKKNY